MTRRLVALAVTCLSLVATTVLTAAPATQAASRCYIDGISPTRVALGLSPVAVTFAPKVHGCTLAAWSIQGDTFFAYEDARREVFYPGTYLNAKAGAEDVSVTAYNSAYDEYGRILYNGFSVLRRSTWQSGTFDASPEPVRKGSTITVKGRLILANWDTQRYRAYTGRTVALEFRTPTGSYSHVKYVTTSSTGWINTRVTAAKTGVWRLRYGGNSIASPATTRGDSVTVT